MSQSNACVIGIDVGTSGVRAVAVDQRGAEVAMARYFYSEIDPTDSLGYRSTALWWGGVEQSLSDVLDSLGSYEVVAISVDGTSGSVLPIDQAGLPLAVPLMYNDAVENQSILEKISRCMPDTSAAGGATSGLAKAISFSESALKPYAIMHQADWIVGRLTDEYLHSDANNALKTGFDPVAMIWPEWISETSDVIPLLPTVATPGDVIAEISVDIAKRFKLASSVKVIAGTTDGCAAFLATGAAETGDAVTSLGSTLTLKLLSDKPVFAPQFGIYSHRIGESWLAGGASNTGGAVLSHYFSSAEIDGYSNEMNTESATQLDYYPLLKPGERFPISDPDLLPRLDPRPESDQLFLQGLLEGIASIEKLGYDQLVAVGGPALNSVRSVGGGASNQSFTRIRSNTLGVEFAQTLSEEAAFGVAMLAKRAADRLHLW